MILPRQKKVGYRGKPRYAASPHRSMIAREHVRADRAAHLGVSQISADMRTLLERHVADVASAEAIELFVYQAKNISERSSPCSGI